MENGKINEKFVKAREIAFNFFNEVIKQWEEAHKTTWEDSGALTLEEGCLSPKKLAESMAEYIFLDYSSIPKCKECKNIFFVGIINPKCFQVATEMFIQDLSGKQILAIC